MPLRLAPAAIAAFHGALTSRTPPPLCTELAFHAEVMVWLPDQVQVSCHPLTGALEVLVSISPAVKPLPQSLLTLYATRQLAPLAGVGVGLGRIVAVADGAGVAERVAIGVGLVL